MMLYDRDAEIVVEWEKSGRRAAGRGRVVGWVSRAKKICAIVVVKRDLIPVPLADLKIAKKDR